MVHRQERNLHVSKLIWLSLRTAAHTQHALYLAHLLSNTTSCVTVLSTADEQMTHLENIQNWDVEIVEATDVSKLPKSISNMEKLSDYGEYDFCKRAQRLAKRLEKIIDSQETGIWLASLYVYGARPETFSSLESPHLGRKARSRRRGPLSVP